MKVKDLITALQGLDNQNAEVFLIGLEGGYTGDIELKNELHNFALNVNNRAWYGPHEELITCRDHTHYSGREKGKAYILRRKNII